MRFLFYFFFFSFQVNATTIYDFEIEDFLSDIIELSNPENQNTIAFSLILDDTPNAFVIENNKIILTSGLLKYINNSEALIGIIAHEIGHINNFHLSKRKQKVKDIQIFDNITNLATITSAILSKNPEIFLQSSITNKSNIQNYYSKYSKIQEREADIFAVNRLNELKISTFGLVSFLKYLEKEFYKSGYSNDIFMFSTHPNYNDRLNIISSFSNEKFNKIDKKIENKFLLIKAKIFGYTENKIEILESHLSGYALDYGEAIILSRQGKLLESLKKINRLILKNENNTFFLETKADILFNQYEKVSFLYEYY